MSSRQSLRCAFFAWLAVICLAPGLEVTAHAATGAATAKQKPAPHSAATAAKTGPACLGKALGGMESIARVSTIYTRYKFEAGGLSGTDFVWRDVRGAVRESLDVPGAFSELTVFDGARGWQRGDN